MKIKIYLCFLSFIDTKKLKSIIMENKDPSILHNVIVADDLVMQSIRESSVKVWT